MHIYTYSTLRKPSEQFHIHASDDCVCMMYERQHLLGEPHNSSLTREYTYMVLHKLEKYYN